jgi:alkylation response protein AidB-like acyl-CoA dehydrogenase
MTLDFSLNREQTAICRSIKELCTDYFSRADVAADKSFRHDLWKKICGIGVLGLPVPENLGGTGYDMLTTALAIQTLGRYCPDEGFVFSLCAHLCTCLIPLVHFGTDKQTKRYLSPLIEGAMIGGNGITEADAGSDTSAIITCVTREKNSYVIDGAKIFVTNAPVSDVLLIYARHKGGMKMMDLSCFVVDKETPGLSLGQTYDKMGLETSPLSEVLLDQCRVSPEDLLGRERFGLQVFNHSMLWERILMSAYHVGAMESQFDRVMEHTGARSQFNRKIKKHDRVADMLVEMKLRLTSSRLMLHHVCWSYDQADAGLPEAAMLKLQCSESKVKNSLDAVQLFGAYGYMKENAVERELRDSIAATIYSGTSQIQRKIIGDQF